MFEFLCHPSSAASHHLRDEDERDPTEYEQSDEGENYAAVTSRQMCVKIADL